ncbi:MAG TPA: hypothetical protein ENK50_03000 [Sedimenticola sp.]|nr:hypothetical protein [Sedimenticola sp.]
MNRGAEGGHPAGPDPTPLMQLSTAYWGAQTLLTANRIGLFECLAQGPKSGPDVAAELGTRPRETELLLKACTALGLLQAVDGKYRNSGLSQAFLVPGSPGYMGNAIRYSDNLYATWGNLEQALRDGTPPMPTETYTGDDPERTRAFVYGMHDRAMGIGRAMVGLVDLGGRRQMLDVGGGPGTYSALFAQRYPELHSRVMDLPGVVAIANEIIASMGVADRVTTQAGDYLQDGYPGGNDVVLISGVFHRESEAGCRELIDRARASLVPGGVLIVGDVFADEGGVSPPFATLFGLNMMLTAPEGGVHTDAEVAGWMAEAGFTGIDTRPLPPPMPHRLVVGEKGV